MTIRLEITAEQPEEFLLNAAKTLALITGRFKKGSPAAQQTAAAAEQAETTVHQQDAEARQRGENIDGSARRETVESEPADNADESNVGEGIPQSTVDIFPKDELDDAPTVSDAEAEPVKTRRGRPPNSRKSEAKTTEVSEPPAESKDGTAEPAATTKTYTDTDITGAIREVISAEEKREYDRRGKKKGADKEADKSVMEHGIRYTMRLLAEFGAQKRSEIPADRFGQFMARARVYIDGTVTLSNE